MPFFFFFSFLDGCTFVQNLSDNPFSLRSLSLLLYFEVEVKNTKIWFLLSLDKLSSIPSQSVTCMASGWWTPRRWWRRRSGGSKSQLSTCAWRAQTDKSGRARSHATRGHQHGFVHVELKVSHHRVSLFNLKQLKTVNVNTLDNKWNNREATLESLLVQLFHDSLSQKIKRVPKAMLGSSLLCSTAKLMFTN